MSHKQMKKVNKKYSQEDKYRHHLGLLRSVMRILDMPEAASLTDIPTELETQLAPLRIAADKAAIYGTAFIQVTAEGKVIVHDSTKVTINVELP